MQQDQEQIADRPIIVRQVPFGPADANADTLSRPVPVEAPVAFEYNGLGYAVMMATPHDIVDFAIGFTLAEGLVRDADAIVDIDIARVDAGWIVRITLPDDSIGPVRDRARLRLSEGSCGLCGIEGIEQVMRPLPALSPGPRVDSIAIARALRALPGHQPLSQRTGAVHAAAFCDANGHIVMVREDVGRHNTLDKLVGALTQRGQDMGEGFVLLTARCSYELVEKTVRAGCPILVTISAPTSLAVERAKVAGLTLVGLARSDSMLVLHDPGGNFA